MRDVPRARRSSMALVACQVGPGLRDKEATVEVVDYHGQKEYMPIDRDFIVQEDGHSFLPVRLIHIDKGQQAALIGLPIEADSGAHRIWVRLPSLKETE